MHESQGGTLSDYHVLIARSSDESLLVQSNKHLPRVHYEGATSCEIEELCQFIKLQFKLESNLVFLRTECEALTQNSSGNLQYWHKLLIFDINSCSQEKVRNGFQWIERENAAEVQVSPAVPAVMQYMREYASRGLGISKKKFRAYSCVGWFKEASTWAEGCLREMGHNPTSIVQVKHCAVSCVLKFVVESGNLFYLKAVPAGGINNEIFMSSSLADILAKEVFVKPLRFDCTKRWMLMRDYGPTVWNVMRAQKPQPELLRSILAQWGRVQLDSD
eukprot:Plantae.Rhodophyta-Hildenbrandia_rubra.ctg970.p1 GENE.Plantae.Rhodophyta-Hildenbrandia_rubra.ctg970~~Plantae.Rhodophyta-Hildenbrandia_rubra.ctg970.p1  ORF type:complete len:275 (-),score=26.52 Plantae.Rhodophyta-Hildenbrandia_rubra.ctg970:1630-2454(-)